jgi:hypothetical protein
MYSITFDLGGYDKRQPTERNGRYLALLLDALYRIDVLYLMRHPGAPKLYQSGVRYQREPAGHEHWQDVARCLELGHGDCEDLACWRAAELSVQGIDARPVYKWKKLRGGGTLFHIVVAHAGGVEDPSARLGMIPRGAAERLPPGIDFNTSLRRGY